MTLRDADRFKDKIEVSLDTRQIFFLFFGGAVVACLVFVLGVMVGRRLEGREQLNRRAATSAAIDPLAALDQLGADEARRSATPDLAFPSALAGKAGERDRPLGAADLAPERPAPGSEARSGDPKPMVETKLPAEPEPPAAAVALAPPAPLPAVPAKKVEAPPVVEKKPEARLEDKKPEAKPVEKKPEAKSEEKKPEAKVEAKAEPKAEGKVDDKKPAGGKGKYTLQLSSFQVRAEADAFAAKVAAAGYRPYVIQSEVEGKGTFFRVRLGAYGSHDEALTAKTDFENKQHIIAYVTRL